jgi:hypothetical protein
MWLDHPAGKNEAILKRYDLQGGPQELLQFVVA